jgi:23S rRNA (uridine2552-2'-O)-methyltransferase
MGRKQYKVKDTYFFRAKRAGYRARSAYKLIGIQKKFKILKEGQTVVDLGSAPGSFLQVISAKVGSSGRAIGVDMQEMDPLDLHNVTLIQANIYQTDELTAFFKKKGFSDVDVVTSDLAPKTSGVKDLDQGRSVLLTHQAYILASKLLKPGGHFIGKVFDGEDLRNLLKEMKPHFRKISTYRPEAVRSSSRETYVVALDFKADTMRS